MVEREREDVITVRLTRDERNMVKGLAAADGVSISDAVRMAVRRAHEQRFAGQKATPKKR
jgi:uncharacterized protein (DUF1778 family)